MKMKSMQYKGGHLSATNDLTVTYIQVVVSKLHTQNRTELADRLKRYDFHVCH